MTMELTVTRAEASHLDRVYANCCLFWRMPNSAGNLAEFLRDESNVLIVAEIGGTPVGQVVGYILRRWDAKPPKLFLYSIDVVESHRRQGIGRRLLEAFHEVGRESGCEEMFVPTDEQNTAAVRLYEACGGRRTTGSSAVTFEWTE